MTDSDTAELLRRVEAGDQQALDQLLDAHRTRLRQMVAVRMNQRITGRVDPSDVVQESLVEASEKLKAYLRQPPIPFYPWLRQIAWEKLIQVHRQHLHAQCRSVSREEPGEMRLPDQSGLQLAAQIIGAGTSPSAFALRNELCGKVHELLSQLSYRDRETLVLRYLEQLSTKETAAVLGLTAEGVKTRLRRAVERFSELLADSSLDDFL